MTTVTKQLTDKTDSRQPAIHPSIHQSLVVFPTHSQFAPAILGHRQLEWNRCERKGERGAFPGSEAGPRKKAKSVFVFFIRSFVRSCFHVFVVNLPRDKPKASSSLLHHSSCHPPRKSHFHSPPHDHAPK